MKRAARPLYLASLRGREDIIEALLSRGSGVNGRDRTGRTAVHAAAEQGQTRALELLVGHGGSVDVRDAEGLTPLHLACQEGHENAARLLADHGAEIDISDDLGETPLHLAALAGDCDVVAFLLERGARPDARDGGGATPLLRASRCGQIGVARSLIAAGADLDAKDDTGRTALDYARLFAFDELASILQEKWGHDTYFLVSKWEIGIMSPILSGEDGFGGGGVLAVGAQEDERGHELHALPYPVEAGARIGGMAQLDEEQVGRLAVARVDEAQAPDAESRLRRRSPGGPFAFSRDRRTRPGPRAQARPRSAP
ncbi:MAG: ankyrin repeat domain-containing protein [Desulfobacterales bacterium]|nr:ankyrin repeat domain-containing protein [Desulfobacterales bacterium]